MKKSIISFVLIFVMLVGMVPAVVASAFGDVAPGAWYAESVDWAVENGITTGVGNGRFAPGDTCTRAQVVTFLWRSQGEPAPAGGENPFADVKEGDYFFDAVLWAVENGVTTGLNADSFGPSSPCTRGQVVTFLWRAMGKPAPTGGENPFADVKDADYFFDAVLWAVENGITTGLSADSFGPSSPCTRGHVVTFLFRSTDTELTPEPEPEPEPDEPEYEGPLSFSLSSNGKSYLVSGCEEDATEVTVPGKYKGLPVTGIAGGAFINCTALYSISVSSANSYLKSEDGVVFSNKGVKTLICFPPAYDRTSYYYVPKDTKVIGPYAFAGLRFLNTLTIPEGVTSMGECAFAEVKTQTMVYVPNSLVVIGEDILKNQQSNMPFYGPSWECAMAKYCEANNLTYAAIVETGPKETTIKTSIPRHSTDNLVPAAERTVFDDYISYDEPQYYSYLYIDRLFNLGPFEGKTDGEVYLPIEDVWELIDPENPQIENFPTQSGLYGAGYTDGVAVLRAYDKDGEIMAMQDISGNFSFSFPNARSIGIEGGSGTKLTVLPIEPIFVASSGSYAIDGENCYKLADGDVFQFLVVQYPYASVYLDFPQHLNLVGSIMRSCTNSYVYENCPNYMIMQLETQDASRLEALKAYAFVFDGLKVLVDNDEFSCSVAKNFNVPAGFGEKCYELLRGLKTLMLGNYYPSSQPISKINIIADGSYPSAYRDTIKLDKVCVETFEKKTIIHEAIHSIDMSIPSVEYLAPTSWMEGRAEYISFKMCDKLGISYWNDYDNFDWSYLSEDNKADFFSYFYNNPDRQTPYAVGYHFVKYIMANYGESSPAKVMAGLAQIECEWDIDKAEAAAHFKKCVEDATEVGVFQNFVRDVIEKN